MWKANEPPFGRIGHDRAGVDVARQPVIRMNRDTWYSSGAFDLTVPLVVHMPDAGGRFMSLLVINQDHYVKRVAHEPGDYLIAQEEIGTRYAVVIVRILVNPDDPADVAAVHALQDAVTSSQAHSGALELPDWDRAGLDGCRSALLALGRYAPAGPGASATSATSTRSST